MQTSHRYVGVEVCGVRASRTLSRTIIGIGLILGRDGQSSLVDCQVALNILNIVVAGVAANDCRTRDNLISVGTLIRLAAAQRDARQNVIALQTAHRHVGVEVLGVRTCRTLSRTVIGVGLVLGRDGQSSLVDGQVALNILNIVVASVAADGRRTRNNLISVGTLVRLDATQCDARQSIIALQTCHRNVGAEVLGVRTSRTLSRTVVGVGLVLGRDGQSSLVDGQVALNIRNSVVAGVVADGCRARDNLISVSTLVRLAAAQRDARQSVIALQTAHRHVSVKASGVRTGRTLS